MTFQLAMHTQAALRHATPYKMTPSFLTPRLVTHNPRLLTASMHLTIRQQGTNPTLYWGSNGNTQGHALQHKLPVQHLGASATSVAIKYWFCRMHNVRRGVSPYALPGTTHQHTGTGVLRGDKQLQVYVQARDSRARTNTKADVHHRGALLPVAARIFTAIICRCRVCTAPGLQLTSKNSDAPHKGAPTTMPPHVYNLGMTHTKLGEAACKPCPKGPTLASPCQRPHDCTTLRTGEACHPSAKGDK